MSHYAQSQNLLAMRPGEEWELRENPPPTAEYERVYAVALLETPEFPFADEQGVHKECRRLTVIAAEVYPTLKSEMRPRIGWVTLEPDTKENIGRELENHAASPGEWFYLVLDTRKHRSE